MTKLEIMKMELEAVQVHAAKRSLEFRIAELHEEIERIEGHVKIQEQKEQEIKLKLEEMK